MLPRTPPPATHPHTRTDTHTHTNTPTSTHSATRRARGGDGEPPLGDQKSASRLSRPLRGASSANRTPLGRAPSTTPLGDKRTGRIGTIGPMEVVEQLKFCLSVHTETEFCLFHCLSLGQLDRRNRRCQSLSLLPISLIGTGRSRPADQTDRKCAPPLSLGREATRRRISVCLSVC